MPKVGAKEFPYSREGIAAAQAESRATGEKITARRSYAQVARAQADKQRSDLAARRGTDTRSTS